MTIADWLGEFLERYQIRLGPHDWPTDVEEFQEFAHGWVQVLNAIVATEAESYAALVRISGAAPPRFRSDHLPAVVAAIKAARQEQAAQLRVYKPEAANSVGTMTDQQRAIYDQWLARPAGDPLRRIARHALGLEPDPGVAAGLPQSLAKCHSIPPTPNPKGS